MKTHVAVHFWGNHGNADVGGDVDGDEDSVCWFRDLGLFLPPNTITLKQPTLLSPTVFFHSII